MRALLVAPRLPGTGHTGDRVRAEVHLEALRLAGFEVALVGSAPATRPIPPIEGVEIHPVSVSIGAMAGSFVMAFLRGDPLQAALLAGPWGDALARAGRRFDLVVLSLVRIWPHVRRRLPGAPLVLDYVDALGAAARQAAEEDPSPFRRVYWRLEAARLENAEREAGACAVYRFATTPFDASALPAPTEALPHGVPLGPRPPSDRGEVVAFSGRLGYRPNELAARRLVERIWPLVRREAPGATLVLGGADAPRWLRAHDGRDGVAVESPVADMPAFLRRARVVATPLDLGTGTPNKLFEAFEAGAAVVASEAATERAERKGVRPPARVARTDEEFAAALVDYLKEPGRAAEDGLRGRAFVEAHADRRRAVARFAQVFSAVAEGRGA